MALDIIRPRAVRAFIAAVAIALGCLWAPDAEAQASPEIYAFNMQDFYGAAELLHEMGEDSAVAPLLLGELYSRGDGLPLDEYEAIYWLRQIESKNGPLTLRDRLERKHPNVPLKDEELFQFYRELADHPNAGPQDWYRLGLVNEEGRGANKDRTAASRWYLKAANSGHDFAQIALSRHYFEVEKNLPEAIIWMGKAADQGNPVAQHYLADMLQSRNEPGDEARAMDLYVAAANQNYGKAQIVSGGLLLKTDTERRDPVEGLKWLVLGLPKVSLSLQRVTEPLAKKIYQSLSDAGRNEARQRAVKFMEKVRSSSD